MRASRRWLSIHLFVGASLQILLYITTFLRNQPGDPLTLYDPRLGLTWLQQAFLLPDGFRGPGPLSWLSALWLLHVARRIFVDDSWLSAYIDLEFLLTAPALLLFLGVASIGLIEPGLGHGNALYAFLPLAEVGVFSVVPWMVARDIRDSLPSSVTPEDSGNQ